MKRPTRKQTIAALAAATTVVLCAGTAFAFWSATSTGSGNASTDTLAAPVQTSPSNVTSTGAQINWTPVTTGWQKDATYTATVSGGGGQTCNALASAGKCSLSGLTSGTTYTVTLTATFATWTSAASNTKTVTPVASDLVAPSSTIAFPATASSYNAAAWTAGCNVAPYNATDTICGTATDNVGGSGVQSVAVSLQATSGTNSGKYWDPSAPAGFKSATEVKTAATFSSGNWTLAFPASRLTPDGTYSVRTYATDNANNTQASGTLSQFTYDTTAPATPTSVALANGGGTGSAYINIANKATAQFNVAWSTGNPANSATDTISVTLTSSGGGTVTGTASRGATSPTVVTVDTTTGTLIDGAVTATASARDGVGNSSGTVTNTATITRDTVAPTATISFPATSPMTVSTFTAGCSTASTKDICGTASDAAGVSTVTTSIQQDTGTTCQHGNSSPQDGQFNQSCPFQVAVGSFTAGVWTESMPATSGHTYAITLTVTDVAGNTKQASFTLTVS